MQYLKVWLQFNESVLLDKCGNNWSAVNSPAVSSDDELQLSGGAYLQSADKILIGGQDFTIDFWAFADSTQIGNATFFSASAYTRYNDYGIALSRNSNSEGLSLEVRGANGNTLGAKTLDIEYTGKLHHFAIVYIRSARLVKVFVDGKEKISVNLSNEYIRRKRFIAVGCKVWSQSSTYFNGSIDEFRFFDGTALWTRDFSPPDISHYAELSFATTDFFDSDSLHDTSFKTSNNFEVDFDTRRKKSWRYENYGNADLLLVEGTTVSLDAAKFKSAFYQTAREKSFDIPATDELWIKFDVFSSNYNQRWRAYEKVSSDDVCGICSISYNIAFWTHNGNVETKQSYLVRDELQTIILHMFSDSVNGVIEAWLNGEKLYSYTGNVNDGKEFQNFYLQSDGASTTFSNVIISSGKISTNENTTLPLDVSFDTKLRVILPFDFLKNFDAQRKIIAPLDVVFDAGRKVASTVEVGGETVRRVLRTLISDCDTCRKVPHKLIISPAENLVVNPAVDNSTGIESFSLELSEQQLWDNLTFATINPVDIMNQIVGQILDYNFDLRVESFSQEGILKRCICCSDIDQLLYTQISYKLPKDKYNGGLYVTDKETGKTTQVEKPNVSATIFATRIAEIMGKVPVILFDGFTSTVDTEQGGVTYQDLISEIFGWTSRIPHKLINVFIRNNFLYFIQRGHEQLSFDISSAQISVPVIRKAIVRTQWGVNATTQKTWEPVLGNEITSGDDEENDGGKILLRLSRTVSAGNEVVGMMNKYSNGLEVAQGMAVAAPAGYTVTETTYEYDGDGDIRRTVTNTNTVGAGIVDGEVVNTRVIVDNDYSYFQGEKYLSAEKTTTYENNERVDSKVTMHLPSGVGQKHVVSVNEDGSVNSSATTATHKTDKPTPYTMKNNLNYWSEQRKQNSYSVEQDGVTFWGDGAGAYTYVDGKKIEIVGYIEKSVDVDKADSNSLYDSSFPVSDADARKATADLKWLNRRIQETVSLNVYNFPHVFDFNDKIILFGNAYFLQSNTMTQTPNISNQQSLQIVRWY